MTDVGPDPQYSPPVLPDEDAAALAARHGLRQTGVRPDFVDYLRDLWSFRHLMWAMAKGEFVADYQDNHLGWLWSIINPILLGISYYLIFGLLIGTRGGIDNFVTFLTIGLFVFIPISLVLASGSKSLLSRMKMIRSLSFPKVLLPLTVTFAHFVSAIPAFVVLVVIALITEEEGPTLEWLLFPVALLVVLVMCLGLALIGSRLVHAFRDLANLMSLITRLLRYVSGVFFSVEASIARFDGAPAWVGHVLEYQPVAIALTLCREPLMAEYPVLWQTWAVALAWSFGLLIVGFVYFWRGEGTYGRA
ncbi:ABC transporter permease [Ornithinimicrobium ciconiae]|uniref:Transport permease protein n=1 Tax=Ornithinimicrobium ciconiae TaxID=2594265 RepID=A0A516G6G8_9MICO|nr:ABC transporter permease [Ornithinimicrobium ciconiae]QDO87103.1 ABC transporter permease [Ornithinimicrobium ciconiae]